MCHSPYPCPRHRPLSDYQVRVNTSKARLTGHILESVKATTYVVVNVHSHRNGLLSVKFDKFDRATVTCGDIMERIHAEHGL